MRSSTVRLGQRLSRGRWRARCRRLCVLSRPLSPSFSSPSPTPSLVQACFDLWRIQRRIIEPANAAYLQCASSLPLSLSLSLAPSSRTDAPTLSNRLLRNYPTIQPLNVYPIYNDRPEATQDGRHWQKLPGLALERPEEGAVGYAVTDMIFEGWRLQEAQELVDVLA